MKLDVYSLLSHILNENKMAEVVRSGKLSLHDIQRLKDSGAIKPLARYYKGIEQGTKNIIKRYGAKVKPGNEFMHNINATTGKPVHTLTFIPRDQPHRSPFFKTDEPRRIWKKHIVGREDFISRRHEADEMRSARKQYLALQKRKNAPDYVVPGDKFISNTRDTTTTGSHSSPEVLRKEREHIDFLRHAFRDPKSEKPAPGEVLHLARVRSGEDKIMRDLDFYNKNKVLKYERNKIKNMSKDIDNTGSNRLHFTTDEHPDNFGINQLRKEKKLQRSIDAAGEIPKPGHKENPNIKGISMSPHKPPTTKNAPKSTDKQPNHDKDKLIAGAAGVGLGAAALGTLAALKKKKDEKAKIEYTKEGRPSPHEDTNRTK